MKYKVIKPKFNVRVGDTLGIIGGLSKNVLGKIIVSNNADIFILRSSKDIENFMYYYNIEYQEAIFTNNNELKFIQKKYIKLADDSTICIYNTTPFYIIGEQVFSNNLKKIEKNIDSNNAYVFDSSITQRKFMNLDRQECIDGTVFIAIKYNLNKSKLPELRVIKLSINRDYNKYQMIISKIRFDSNKLNKYETNIRNCISNMLNTTSYVSSNKNRDSLTKIKRIK